MKNKKVICLNKNFTSLTYGKVYDLIKDEGSYILLVNDKGTISSPSKQTLGFQNFISVEEFRNKKIEKILDID
jgi:hypothetical protein